MPPSTASEPPDPEPGPGPVRAARRAGRRPTPARARRATAAWRRPGRSPGDGRCRRGPVGGRGAAPPGWTEADAGAVGCGRGAPARAALAPDRAERPPGELGAALGAGVAVASVASPVRGGARRRLQAVVAAPRRSERRRRASAPVPAGAVAGAVRARRRRDSAERRRVPPPSARARSRRSTRSSRAVVESSAWGWVSLMSATSRCTRWIGDVAHVDLGPAQLLEARTRAGQPHAPRRCPRPGSAPRPTALTSSPATMARKPWRRYSARSAARRWGSRPASEALGHRHEGPGGVAFGQGVGQLGQHLDVVVDDAARGDLVERRQGVAGRAPAPAHRRVDAPRRAAARPLAAADLVEQSRQASRSRGGGTRSAGSGCGWWAAPSGRRWWPARTRRGRGAPRGSSAARSTPPSTACGPRRRCRPSTGPACPSAACDTRSRMASTPLFEAASSSCTSSEAPAGDLDAGVAAPARLAVLDRRAVQRLGQDAGRRRLAGAARAAEQVRVPDAARRARRCSGPG